MINNLLFSKISKELEEFNVFISRLFSLAIIYIWFYLVKELVLNLGRFHGLVAVYDHGERVDWI